MNISPRKDVSLRDRKGGDDEDEEDGYYERRALIDDEELCDDEIDLLSTGALGIRQRQPAKRALKADLGFNYQGGMHELKNFNNNRARDPNGEFAEFATYEIQPGDSLSSICLRFACSINQVKRLNGIMNDQEFYGLRLVKLPMGKMGLLEDILKTNANSQDLLSFQDSSTNIYAASNPANGRQLSKTPINSPGCALSVSTNSGYHSNNFKPLLSPGLSSDRINELSRTSPPHQNYHQAEHYRNGLIKHNHSHSFSSLRDFASDTNIYMGAATNENLPISPCKTLQSFIKSDLPDHEDQVDDLIMTSDANIANGKPNVHRVFEDLDYHVERAKAAAENYDQRAAELVDRIDINGPSTETRFRPRVSKIPELFFCNENFGLNSRKLLVIIFVICILVPLIYLNQSTEGHSSQL